MWIKIEIDIFKNSDFEGLNYIFNILSWSPPNSISRYNIFIDLEEIKHLENYTKLKGLKNDLELLIEKQFDDFINSKSKNSKTDFQISNEKTLTAFNIEESIRFFGQPVSIVLENSKNDAYFIKAIIEYFDKVGVVKEHLKNGWIAFENAGGCTNVQNFIEGELKSFEDIASRNNRNTFDYFRGFVVLDSDKEYPSQLQKNQYIVLCDWLNSISLNDKFHIFAKRMMENYMPDEVFEDIKSHLVTTKGDISLIKWINVYLSLTKTEQKDYLNIKSGFSKEKDNVGNRKPILTEILNLYNISKHDFDILDIGFNFPNFKTSFPELFVKSPRVNKFTLDKRANTNELDEILDKISKLL